MIGLAVNLAFFAADQAVQSAKMVNGFTQDRVQDIHGFAVDRAQDIHGLAFDRAQEIHGFAKEILRMFQHAAETAKTCTIESVKQVHDFAQGTAQAMRESCERAISTVKQWMAIVVVLVKLSWGAARGRFRSAPGGRVLATVPKKTNPRYTREAKKMAEAKAGAKAGVTRTSKKRTRKHKGKTVKNTGEA